MTLAGDSGPAIDLRGLHKKLGQAMAVDGLSLTVPRGSIYALLGPNGAGKTTTLKLMLGMSCPDRGEGWVFGHPIDRERDSIEIRRRTGYVSETKELFPQLTVRRTIDETRPHFPRWRPDVERRLLEQFELPLDRRVHALSKGMRSKLALLLACCRGADLLVLDEPTDSLDPGAAEQILETVLGLVASDGVTVLLSSHRLEEVERIADHIAIVQHGRVIIDGELDDLRQRMRQVRVTLEHDAGPSSSLYDEAGVLHARRDGRIVSLLVDGKAGVLADRASWLTELRTVDVHPVSLRDLYLTLTAPRTDVVSRVG
jgi:ABC-2 type transport system ATP-binding protein